MKCNKVFRILAMALILSLVVMALPAASVLAAERINVSPNKGKVDDNVDVSGSGFTEGDDVYIYFSNEEVDEGDDVEDLDSYEEVATDRASSETEYDDGGDIDTDFDVPDELKDGSDDHEVTGGTYYVYATEKEEGKILGTICPECDLTYVPPRLYCERCFAQLDEWVDVPSIGHVHTFTILHVDLNGERLTEPRVLAFIRLDGADGGLVHFVDDIACEDVYIGMRVEAVFEKKEKRTGSILDIAYFRPA